MLFWLSLIDIATGVLYLFDPKISSFILVALLWFHIIKGFFSIAGSWASGYYFDWMGWIDFIAGIAVLFRGTHILESFFAYVIYALIFKGIYTMIRGLVKI